MDPYIGEIRLFAGNFAPVNWALCQGQLLAISQNTALFSLLGTNYGGNGTNTFGLPDLRGRAIVNQGQGPGLSPYFIGETLGLEAVTLTTAQISGHSHALQGTSTTASSATPSANLVPAAVPAGQALYGPGASNVVTLAPASIGPAGGNTPHDNRQPYLALNYIIALQGVFPPRS